jgi:hypothetical protein
LVWFCWMWLVAVVGRCVAGCEHCEGFCSTCRDRNQKTPPTRAICPAHLIFLRGPFLAPRHIIIHFAAFFRLKYRRPYRPIYDLTPDTGNLLLVSAAAVDTALSVTWTSKQRRRNIDVSTGYLMRSEVQILTAEFTDDVGNCLRWRKPTEPSFFFFPLTNVKVNQSRYRPEVAQRVPGS